MNIMKFSGANDDYPVRKWLWLFNVKAEALQWTDDIRVANFIEYLEGSALEWYLSEIFDTDEAWDDVKRLVVERFGTPATGPFRSFIHYTKKGGQSVTGYYEETCPLGCLANLKDAHIIAGLIDGLLNEIGISFVGLSIDSPSQWFFVAWGIESTLAVSEKSQSPRPLQAKSISLQRALLLVQRRGSQSSIVPSSSRPAFANIPKPNAGFCASSGLSEQMRWHNMCPNSSVVSNSENDQGN